MSWTPDPEWHAKYEARQQAARLRKGEQLVALASIDDPTLRAVIDLHSRDQEDDYWNTRCSGCDQGCSCDAPDWPCSTITAVLESLGVDTTDIDLADWRNDL